ncbi:hypothetical protein [Butyrivibrio sp. AE3006]|uniref:hypothetical protein n=1 Tax=Butyrivibrio sp. AE3006 TaxID=1280673 RepID=UPI00041C213B|nr:hypothetical protein [Butyrivibrio sp. AE3006]
MEKLDGLLGLPWQALYDKALVLGLDHKEVKECSKEQLAQKLVKLLDHTEIQNLIDDYVYGDRVTFTLWSIAYDNPLTNNEIIKKIEYSSEEFITVAGFRKLNVVSVTEYDDRIEIVYTYSKEHAYIDESGHNSSNWEMSRGCVWIGTKISYIASIGKHEKMASFFISYLASKLHLSIKQIKPPKKAIERCTNNALISRVVLQGFTGEKTIISKSDGLTQDQMEEMLRIKVDRIDISGSLRTELIQGVYGTIRYNLKKGSIGIHKHLPSSVLFLWTQEAIKIIFEEIDNLRAEDASKIFQELGIQAKWPNTPSRYYSSLMWILSKAISSTHANNTLCCGIPDFVRVCLEESDLFAIIPLVYCDECESFEIPICADCGNVMKITSNGSLTCQCGNENRVTCGENHTGCKIQKIYYPNRKLQAAIETNLKKISFGNDYRCQLFFCDDECWIIGNVDSNKGTEIRFDDIDLFNSASTNEIEDKACIEKCAVCLNEKCGSTCSYSKINTCIRDSSMMCLPKLFYNVIPGYRPQPHRNGEYGDASGQIKIGSITYEMICIIKKNTKNTRNTDTQKMIIEPLKATSKAGEEIIRQFVEQGISDSRVELIAVMAPQYFDAGLKATLRSLAKLGRKKIMFIELDAVCRLLNYQRLINQ